MAATVTLRGGFRAGVEAVSARTTTTTGADGSFKFAEATETGNQLRVEGPGFATAQVQNARAGALRKPVSLAPGRAISGSVLLPDRRTPAAGALVRFEGNTTTRWAEVRRDGSFLVEGVPAESGSIVADGGDRGRATVPAPEAGSRASLVLAPTAGIRGRVVDATTGAPVAGIRVVAGCGSALFTGRSGADGRYEVRGLPSGSCRLSADDPRYVRWDGRQVTTAAGAMEAQDVPLVRAATLAGRVVDPDGRPVEGALGQVFRGRETSVRAFFRSAGAPAFRSGPDGTFKASRVAPGDNLRLIVDHENFEPRTLGGIALVAGGTKSGLTVVLSRGFTVRGLVKDENDLPVSGADVELLRSRTFQSSRRGEMAQIGLMGGPGQQPKKTTGPDGRFEFRGLSAGDYTLVASRKGLTRERVDPLKVVDGPEGEPVQVVLRAGAAVTGFVRDKAGNGVEGWVVGVRPQGSSSGPFAGLLGQGPPERTGPDGSFLVEGLTAGESYELQLFNESGPGPRKSGVVAPADVELVVSGKGRIRGTVVDGDTGRPIPDFEVSYQPASPGGIGMRFSGPGRSRGPGASVPVHADDGSFMLDDVAPGKWDVAVTADGYQKGRAAGITVDEGGTAEGADVRLVRGGTITGRVVEDRTGKAVLDATVRAELAGGRGGAMFFGGPDEEGPGATDAEGRFEIEGLAPGSYTITATHPDWTEETERVELKDQPASVEIRLGRGGAIGGSVLAGGRGVAGATVSLSAAGQSFRGPFGGGQTAITDEGGRFRFDRLSAGRYTLVASLRTQGSAPVEAVLQAGESSQEVSLVLAEGAAIHGTVTGLSENARGNVMVSANGPEEYFANTRTAGDGSFELTGAPQGPISLRANAGDFATGLRSAAAQIVIAEGQTDAAVEIVFETGFRVEGNVTRGGRPVTDAMVSAIPEGGGGRQSSGRTDDAGAFQIEGLKEGTYTLNASSMMGGGGSIRKTIKVTGDMTVDLEAPPARIAGRIVEAESGRPVAEAMVRAEQGGGAGGPFSMMASDSDSSGRFSVENLEPRSYRVSVTKPSYQAETRDVVASEESDLTIELRRGEGVGLIVRDGIFGTPLRGVFVRVLDTQGATVFTGSVSLDSDGGGDIPSLKPGRYEARIGADGYASVVLPAVAVPAPPLTVSLTPGGTLEIQSGPQTLARPTASGRLLGSGGSVYYPSVFSDGVVRLTRPVLRLDHVAPGRYTFAVDGGPRREFDLREGGAAVVTLP